MSSLNKLSSWIDIGNHSKKISEKSLNEMFNDDKDRFSKFSIQRKNRCFSHADVADEGRWAAVQLEIQHLDNESPPVEKFAQIVVQQQASILSHRSEHSVGLRGRSESYVLQVDSEFVLSRVGELY